MNAGTNSILVAGDIQITYTPDKMDDLLDLVEEMWQQKIDMNEFRERFVMGFLARSYGEPLDSVAVAIEGAFVVFDPMPPLTLEQLRDQIFIIAGIAEAVQGKRPPAHRRFMQVTVTKSGNNTEEK